MDIQDSGGTLERSTDLGTDPRAKVKRWLLELQLADKREKDWRDDAEKVWNKYRQKKAKENSFNILWSNTETLRPAVYNSVPNADVRRRFKDADPLGKAVSQVLQRAISYSCDTYDFDGIMKGDVLDMLLPGRAVSRIRYVPTLAQVGVTPETHEEENEQHEPAGEALEGDSEELQWEQVVAERVHWDDLRIGPGKEWSEVTWVAFRHRLSRDELVDKFGDVGEKIPLDNAEDEEIKAEKDERVSDLFKTALVWEIWDKDEREVLFIAPSYKESPALEVDDPLELIDFFPIPRPLYAIEDSNSLLPVPLYMLYTEQAEELDRISGRINVIVKGLKLRGIFDSTISELGELMRGNDNDLIPAQHVTALLERGGLEKAVWMWPIETAANVLKVLYEQRDASKQVIYEITGIADIVRGASVASETATAQSIKDKWSNIRLKKMQQEVQRYIRDLIRMKGEIISEKFQLETLQQMTGLKFPMLAEKEQAQAMYQQAAMQAQQSGQQPPPPPPEIPCWEEILEAMRNDASRMYKIDIETDSTISATVDQDMQSLQQVSQAIGMALKEWMPLVQVGDMPIDALKELLLSIARRARFGNAFEDAIDKIQQPPPKQPEQDNSMQVEQVKQQGEMQRFQVEQQADQAKMQQEAAIESQRLAHEERLEQIRAQSALMVEQAKTEADADLKWRIAQLDAETKVIVAQIGAAQKAESDRMSAQNEAARMAQEGQQKAEESAEAERSESSTQDALTVALQGFQAAIERLSQPRTVIRGPDGRVAGIQ